MRTFSVTVLIRATPERIWAIITDAARYPVWNSTVRRIEGSIASGERITVHAAINPGRAFPLRVNILRVGREMTWSGGMPFGLFQGKRTFTLHPRDQGQVEFCMREEYTGLLAPLITRSIPDLQPAFNQFGEDLKNTAEGGSSKPPD